MKTFIKSLAMAALGCIMMAGPAMAVGMGDTSKTIKLAINEWTGQHVTTRIAGAILEEAGYDVEYVTAGYGPQFIAMADGDLHATLEIWSSNVPGLYHEVAATGKIKDIGSLELVAREGVLYPLHMKDMCPGLPAWRALQDCARKFASVETLPKGRLLDYPADWGSPGADRFGALGIDYTAVPAGSEGAMVTELKASVDKKSPLLMTFWQPHWALSEFDTEWVALPKGVQECYDDPSWGTNKSATGDCDFIIPRIYKVVWSGFDDTWPLAGQILKDFTIDADTQQNLMAAIDGRGEDIDDVVADYVSSNRSMIRDIVRKAKAK